ncbi:MAG: hypothetical protein JRJ87_12810 [Deltaproteobacteria bacterium]|nr:hypothetical protein [Deltaproteobacteria bacterium]
MKKIIPFVLFGIFLLLLVLSPSPARAGGSLLTISDLEQTIHSLPERKFVDPLKPLIMRLAELTAAKVRSDERTGLNQAVALIKILRQTRITAARAVSTVQTSNSHFAFLVTSQVPSR